MKLIPLGGYKHKGKFVKIDDDKFEGLNKYKWCYSSNRGGYVVRRSTKVDGNKVIPMHRQIMNPPPGFFVDHKNGDGLDNQVANLRVCSHQQNQMNQKKRRTGLSKYKGVVKYRRPGKWVSFIQWKGKATYIGIFDNEHQAALMYDLWQIENYGDFARTNFKVVSHTFRKIGEAA